ncbi:hypothetical protein [Bosea sp. CS1GBMeth4]|uniref:hypothetical protein n=1 Tax=Bosea sp. CS1GBMeth4 TaxID=1892849 RepID=UPI001648D3D0|nr:hypothetical protein [Bosea sp. CS1GBMeth4]
MTGEGETRRRAIERLHQRHARHGLADVAKPASADDSFPVLLLAGFLAVTLLASVLMRAVGG